MSGHIRRARPEEHDRISEIRFAVQENQLSDPTLVRFTEHPGIWVWEEDGQILGFSAGDTRDGTIWALFVDPAHHHRGIGRALFEAACDTPRRAGHRSAMLTTAPGTRAERFYRAAGWTVVGTSKRGELMFTSIL
jgi:GNAT superfamily N-acetyltransferase